MERPRTPQRFTYTNWRRWYTASVHETLWPDSGQFVRRLVVKRRSGRGDIGWDALQQIKSDMLGPDVVAVEVYPDDSDVVNEVNARHLWEVPSHITAPNLARRGE